MNPGCAIRLVYYGAGPNGKAEPPNASFAGAYPRNFMMGTFQDMVAFEHVAEVKKHIEDEMWATYCVRPRWIDDGRTQIAEVLARRAVDLMIRKHYETAET